MSNHQNHPASRLDAIMSLPAAKGREALARALAATNLTVQQASETLAAAPSGLAEAARIARIAEAKANTALYARMTGRRREAVQDHRPPPANAAVAAARAFGDTQRRLAGKPPRTGL